MFMCVCSYALCVLHRLEVEDAIWTLHCDCYGADVETQGTLDRSGKESLVNILQVRYSHAYTRVGMCVL